MKLKKFLVNFSISALSVGVCLLVCEFVSRHVLNPSDFLSVEMVHDDVLGAVPAPSAMSGFDSWGFRNPKVPQTSDIVAIGDSHTYGNTAKMNDSWPMVLARLTGKSVYNMGMGGYGPNQYLYLLQTKALNLKPKLVICGFYMGDDFENAFSITYGLDHWSFLRERPAASVNYDIWKTVSLRPSWQKRIRIWLSQHSVVYQLLFHVSILGRLQGQAQIEQASHLDDAVTSLVLPDKNILEAFRPTSMLTRIDQDSPNVREGMRITFKLFQEMDDICRKNHVQFLVVVIPAKEMVFSEDLEHNPSLHLSDVLDKLIVNERLARDETFKFFADSKIQFVDALQALKASVQNELYARTAADMHPSKNGYRVIAQAIFGAMDRNDFAPSH